MLHSCALSLKKDIPSNNFSLTLSNELNPVSVLSRKMFHQRILCQRKKNLLIKASHEENVDVSILSESSSQSNVLKSISAFSPDTKDFLNASNSKDIFQIRTSKDSSFDVDYLGESTKGDMRLKRTLLDRLGLEKSLCHCIQFTIYT
jgi:hypothetical protein